MRYPTIITALLALTFEPSAALEIKRNMLGPRANEPSQLSGPAPGQSIAEYASEQLRPLKQPTTRESNTEKRQALTIQYSSENNLATTYWDSDNTRWNISVDSNPCKPGLRFTSKSGGYIFTNDTFKEEVTLKDIILDLQVFRPTDDPLVGYAAHTVKNLNSIITELETLGDQYICPQTGVARADEDRYGLRKLLSVGTWIALLIDSGIGGLIAAGLAAAVKGAFEANITAESLVEVGVVSAGVTFAVNFRKTISEQGNRLPGENAWTGLLWIGLLWQFVLNIKRLATGQPTIPAATVQQGVQMTQNLQQPNTGACVNPDVASQAAQALQGVAQAQAGLQTYADVENQVGGAVGAAGQCNNA